ncbi:diacylglycerol kinase family protein [Cytobacillus suaedae]|nr:diacylglycerol kinase family protein [Cytobacillus suaedae]
MDLKDKRKPEVLRLLKSFSFATEGLIHAIKRERNLQIHLVISVFVIGLSFYLNITKIEWSIVIILIGGMLSLELMNTAIERVVDLVTKEYHPIAKIAKDVAAAAVLVFALISVVVGSIIFSSYISSL